MCREWGETKVFEVRELTDEIHEVVLGTWWVYKFQRSDLLCQVSKVLFKDGKEGGWVELVKCESGQPRKGLELREVWLKVFGRELFCDPDREPPGVMGQATLGCLRQRAQL